MPADLDDLGVADAGEEDERLQETRARAESQERVSATLEDPVASGGPAVNRSATGRVRGPVRTRTRRRGAACRGSGFQVGRRVALRALRGQRSRRDACRAGSGGSGVRHSGIMRPPRGHPGGVPVGTNNPEGGSRCAHRTRCGPSASAWGGLACAGCRRHRSHRRRRLRRVAQGRPLPTWKVYTLKPGRPHRRTDARRTAFRRALLRVWTRCPRPSTPPPTRKARVALQGEVRLPALGPARVDEAGGKRRQVLAPRVRPWVRLPEAEERQGTHPGPPAPRSRP